jgi:phage gpG-like protein
MARILIDFDAAAKADVIATFREFVAKAKDPKPVFQDFGGHMQGSVRTNFIAGGRPERWPGLRPQSMWNWVLSRKSWRKGPRQGGRLSAKGLQAKKGRKVMINTARLMGSIFWKLIPGGVAVGTRTKYGAIHQFGGVIPSRVIRPTKKKALYWPGAGHPVKKAVIGPVRIPPRPFLVVQDEDWAYLVRHMKMYL